MGVGLKKRLLYNTQTISIVSRIMLQTNRLARKPHVVSVIKDQQNISEIL